jgi:hypothetical protein
MSSVKGTVALHQVIAVLPDAKKASKRPGKFLASPAHYKAINAVFPEVEHRNWSQ